MDLYFPVIRNCRASEEGQKEIVKLLIEYGADGRIHPVTKYSPLYIACYGGRKDIAEILLKVCCVIIVIFLYCATYFLILLK